MENRLRFVLMPSLEQMALRRVAVALYSDPRILASIATFRFEPNHICRNIWEATHPMYGFVSRRKGDWRLDVKGAVSTLQLPESLRMQMVTAVKAVGSEIVAWKSVHEEYLSTSTCGKLACLQKLCWTGTGAVDYKRTAQGLVTCNSLDIEKRFELACLYCLEDSIPLLWEELPDENKRTFCDDEVASRFGTPQLHLLLPSVLEKQPKMYDRSVSSRNSFEKSALCGNKTLTEFCFRNMTKEKREASLIRTAKNVISVRNIEIFSFDYRRAKLSDVLCYLLSLMTPEEQIGIFREEPYRVLRCFLDWPWQDLFLDIADDMWTYFTESEYNHLVSAIYKSMFFSGYYFPTFFQNLFLRSPREFRRRFVAREIGNGSCLRTILVNEDTETIRVILRSLDTADRMRLVLSEWSLDFILQPVNKWRVVEAFLRAGAPSREDKQRLKEDFKAFLEKRGLFQRTRERRERILEFVE